MSRRRLFAGPQLRKLRSNHKLRQAELAEQLGISASYLSQLEHDDRPLTSRLVDILAQKFPLDWTEIGTDDTEQLAFNLREAAADPLFAEPLPVDALARIAEQQPAFARRFVALHEAYRLTSQRLEMMDEALSVDSAFETRLPWEEVRDWFHLSNNYVDEIDRAAEQLSMSLIADAMSPSQEELERELRKTHGISTLVGTSETLREFDETRRELLLAPGQPPEGKRFQTAYHLAAMSLGVEIAQVADDADLQTSAARELLMIGLVNYAAGAILLPYDLFRKAAREFRHDIDRLSQAFGTSFEQTCHRLSTLQREGSKGMPVFFCRVDMAGNITKRHSATRLQFARFGGACPLWIVHEAVAIPDRVLVQLAETPEGARYVSMAKGLVKPSGRFDRAPRRYAVALGCEVRHAGEFVYADGLDTESDSAATRIGISCRICPRLDCDQRAYPPSDQNIAVDLFKRGKVPYELQASEKASDN